MKQITTDFASALVVNRTPFFVAAMCATERDALVHDGLLLRFILHRQFSDFVLFEPFLEHRTNHMLSD